MLVPGVYIDQLGAEIEISLALFIPEKCPVADCVGAETHKEKLNPVSPGKVVLSPSLVDHQREE
jgi:hypothetical protein